MIILGVDLGARRVGFAVSDDAGRLAVQSGCAAVRDLAGAAAAVGAKAAAERAELVLLGHPVNMDGRPGPKSREAESFRDLLTEAGLAVILWDERLTTAEAARGLREAGVNRRRQRGLVDAAAAQRLLASYLEFRRRADEEAGAEPGGAGL